MVLSDDRLLGAHLEVRRGHLALAGGGADGLRRRRRAAPGRRPYATSASTPLFFAQAIGRFVRSRRPGETASIFLPSVPNLLLLASEMEAQRNHVLGKPHRETLDDPLEAELAKQNRDEPDDLENKIEYLGADAELDQVIFDGASFGTDDAGGQRRGGRLPGIPGLLDAASMRDLLRRRQEEQLTKRTARRDAADLDARPVARVAQPAQRAGVGGHHRTGRSHGWIHNELRRICGGRRWRRRPVISSAHASRRCAASRPDDSQPGAPRNSWLQTEQPRQVGDGISTWLGCIANSSVGPAVQGVLVELSGAHKHPGHADDLGGQHVVVEVVADHVHVLGFDASRARRR